MYKGLDVQTVLYGDETCGARAEDRKGLNVFEIKCCRGIAGVTLRDSMNDDVD